MARRVYLDGNGLRVSKPGEDALSSSPDDLLLDTVRQNTTTYFAGILQGTGTYAGDLTSKYGIYQIKAHHGLGYIPMFHAEHVGGGSVDIRIDGSDLIMQFYQ